MDTGIREFAVAEAAAAVPTSMVEDVYLVGPPAKIRDDLAMWEESGVTMLVVMASPGTDLRAIAEHLSGRGRGLAARPLGLTPTDRRR